MSIDTVREALIKLRDFAKRLDCDYQEKCTPGEDDMCESCKHVYIAELAIATLSAIDPEVIRRECVGELSKVKEKLCGIELNLCNYNDDNVRELQNNMFEGVAMLTAIIGNE